MAGLQFVRVSLLKFKIKDFIIMAAALAAVVAALIILRPVVVKSLTVEAGAPCPAAAEFIINAAKSGDYVSGLPEDTSAPGAYDIIVAIGKKKYAVTLIVEDTVAPRALAAPLAVWVGAAIQPWDFVREVYDASLLELSFANAPDTSVAGVWPVAVVLTDAGGNTTTVLSELRVYDTIAKLDIRPDTDKSALTALDFITPQPVADKERFALETDLEAIDFSIPGRRDIAVTLDGAKRFCVLDVLDITPPTAKPVHVQRFVYDIPEPGEFVEDIVDQTPVSVSFVVTPDNMLEGEQPVTILLTDAYGNTAKIDSTLTLIRDTEPPVIKGELDKTVFIGDTITYRAGITITDNRDAEIMLKIDADAVDTRAAGKYPVLYSATDSSGNTASAQGSVTVIDVSREQVYAMADKVLAEIVAEDMNPYDKANAIYVWVRSSVGYISAKVSSDPILAAYRGLKNRRGECFILASTAELLLTRAGIDNVMIQRLAGARTTHYWSLVNVGQGWYHFDTTPHINGGNCFMLTESQLQALGIRRGSSKYYAYDPSLYPEVVQ